MAPTTRVYYVTNPPIPEIILRLSAVARSLKTFREPLRLAVRTVITPRVYTNFDEGGADTAWAPLAPATVAWKFNNGYAGVAFEALKRTGKLQTRGAQINNWVISSDSATLQNLPSEVEYGAAHQTGYRNARTGGNVPARPWVAIKDSDTIRIEGIIETFAATKFGLL